MGPDRKNLRLLTTQAFLIIAVILTSCAREEKKAVPPPGAPVTATAAVKKDVPVELEAIGEVEAYSTVSVKSMINGRLENVHFREGQDVNEGDLLFTIDPRPFEAALKEAEAALAKDTSLLDTAVKDYARFTELLKGGYVTQAQYDQAKSSARALDAAVKGDLAAVDNAKLNLEYCFIRSPVNGRTGGILINRGNVIKANDDKPMLIIYRVLPIYVNFSVPEKYLSGIKRLSSRARLEVDATVPPPEAGPLAAFGSISSKGELTFIDNEVDKKTGTIHLKGTFDNRDRLLWPGQFVNVALRLYTRKDAVVVPARAVQTSQSGQYVFVVRPDNTAQERPVVAGITFGKESASQTVIEKGVLPGETVVTDGQLQLTTGTKVEIKGRAGTGGISPAGGVESTAGISAAAGGGTGSEKPPGEETGGGIKRGY